MYNYVLFCGIAIISYNNNIVVLGKRVPRIREHANSVSFLKFPSSISHCNKILYILQIYNILL